MHRTVLLTPLLALALASACGGKGEQSAGELDGRALEDQDPPSDDQRPPPSGDQRPPSSGDRAPSPEPQRTPEDDSCESVCEAAEEVCVIRGCVNNCRAGSSDFPRCHAEWVAALRCVVDNGLICAGQGRSDQILERCASQYAALNRCAGFFEEEEEEERAQ